MADKKKSAPKAPAAPAVPNAQRPEAAAEAVPTYRVDMGESLPPQKESLNPDRAK